MGDVDVITGAADRGSRAAGWLAGAPVVVVALIIAFLLFAFPASFVAVYTDQDIAVPAFAAVIIAHAWVAPAIIVGLAIGGLLASVCVRPGARRYVQMVSFGLVLLVALGEVLALVVPLVTAEPIQNAATG